MNTSATATPAPASCPTPNLPFRGDPSEAGKRGPSEGRAISARNATTHGLFARDVVLTQLGEDPAAFDALLEQLMAQLPPRHLLERHYLEQIAAASWRLRRLHRWQAQIYEDDTLTEDDRLDKLDKVLRHETALTRQIDRAIRMMNRDLAWLFQSRARDEALYQQNVTEADCREYDELAIAVQQRVWKQARSFSPDADLDYSRLDAAPPPADDTKNCQNEKCKNEPPPQTQNCKNEPVATMPSVSEAHASPIPIPPGEGWPRNEAGVGLTRVHPPPPPNLPFRGDPAKQGREVSDDFSPPSEGGVTGLARTG